MASGITASLLPLPFDRSRPVKTALRDSRLSRNCRAASSKLVTGGQDEDRTESGPEEPRDNRATVPEDPPPLCERCGERHPTWSRCPFQKGHELSVKHGATATLKLGPRAAEIAEVLRFCMPVDEVADEPAIQSLALILARIEAAHTWLDENGLFHGKGDPQPVLKVLSTWENSARLLMRDLGLSAASRVAIGLDLVRTQREAVTLEELQSAMRRFANAALRYISPADREAFLEDFTAVVLEPGD